MTGFTKPPSGDRVEILRSMNGEWYWRIVARNGEIIATAGETFTRKWSAKRAARRVTRGSA